MPTLDLAIAAGLNALFFALAALVLWPMGKAGMAGDLAKGFCAFAIAVALVSWIGRWIQRLLRIESDPPSTAFVIMNLVVSGALQVGWAVYAAMAASRFAESVSFWITAAVYIAALLSSVLATTVTGAFYQGQLYKMVNALLSIVAYVVVAVWKPGVLAG